jgi:prepilin-type N-terminal cleavage/methylation domain-containing protein
MKHRCPHANRRAFTLIELLIVLAIIGLLAAILFPVFRSAKEKGYQTHCAANLMQIYQAAQLYRQDEKYYPSSLAFLLPSDMNLDDGTAAGAANTDGTGYFKGGRDGLVCDDDDTDTSTIRSSYGDISFAGPPASSADMGRYVWNYWGYRKDDGASCTAGTTDVHECAGTAFSNSTDAATAGNADTTLLLTPSGTYDSRKNPIKYSLSNRYAPTSTIITHCVFHRMPTANGKISDPFQIYTDPTNGAGGRDIILRLDGTAKLLDVSAFTESSKLYWQKQNF